MIWLRFSLNGERFFISDGQQMKWYSYKRLNPRPGKHETAARQSIVILLRRAAVMNRSAQASVILPSARDKASVSEGVPMLTRKARANSGAWKKRTRRS